MCRRAFGLRVKATPHSTWARSCAARSGSTRSPHQWWHQRAECRGGLVVHSRAGVSRPLLALEPSGELLLGWGSLEADPSNDVGADGGLCGAVENPAVSLNGLTRRIVVRIARKENTFQAQAPCDW